jgi:hypothetical protein
VLMLACDKCAVQASSHPVAIALAALDDDLISISVVVWPSLAALTDAFFSTCMNWPLTMFLAIS